MVAEGCYPGLALEDLLKWAKVVKASLPPKVGTERHANAISNARLTA
jgi:hypothetical protein